MAWGNFKQAQSLFFYLCFFCFIILIAYGFFEFLQQLNDSKQRIILFSANPISAGSLLILLSSGPLLLLTQTKTNWEISENMHDQKFIAITFLPIIFKEL